MKINIITIYVFILSLIIGISSSIVVGNTGCAFFMVPLTFFAVASMVMIFYLTLETILNNLQKVGKKK